MMDLNSSLHPQHGIVMVNLHRGGFPGLWKQLQLKLSGQVWLDPFVTPTAKVYRLAPSTLKTPCPAPFPLPILANNVCSTPAISEG